MLWTLTAIEPAHAQWPESFMPRAAPGAVSVRPEQSPAPAAPRGTSNTPRRPRWTIEIHAGALGGASGGGGTAALPPPGQAFTTQTLRPSRHVSSWYFGDGAAFYNELPAGVRNDHTMVPLDPALHQLPLRRTGASIGGRVGFALGDQLGVEVGVDYGAGPLVFDETVTVRVEQTRASFTDAWNAALRFLNAPSVSSEAAVLNDRGGQLLTTGELVLALGQRGRLRPFVAAGAGWATGFGHPSVTLTGQYSFLGSTLNRPFSETDLVRVRYTTRDAAFITAGGGVTYEVTPRTGIRVDVRAQTEPDPRRTMVDAAPSFVPYVTPSWVAGLTTPALQFANNGLPGAPIRSTLRGATFNDFVTSEATGWAARVNVTAGWFVRF
jgi:hypothetical protein